MDGTRQGKSSLLIIASQSRLLSCQLRMPIQSQIGINQCSRTRVAQYYVVVGNDMLGCTSSSGRES